MRGTVGTNRARFTPAPYSNKSKIMIKSISAAMRALPALNIGEFSIGAPQDGKIMIFHKSGEGGEFSSKSFERAIEKYYSENF